MREIAVALNCLLPLACDQLPQLLCERDHFGQSNFRSTVTKPPPNNFRNFNNRHNVGSLDVATIQRRFHDVPHCSPGKRATRMPHPQSMASGDLTITLSRVGSFRAGRHGDYAQTSHVLDLLWLYRFAASGFDIGAV
jgi:hypothetical protein